MIGFRKIFLASLGRCLKALPTHFLLKVTNQKGILPFYHSISNQDLPHIKNLYMVKNLTQFEADLDFLLNHFTPIDIHTFLNQEKINQLTKPYFFISFDDGLSEFYHLIAPLLLKKGIPAACFLNSDFVDNKGLFYRYKASLLIELIKKSEVKEKIANAYFNNKKTVQENLLAINIQNQFKIEELSKLLDFSFTNFLKEQQPYLKTEQIKELIEKGFHFGAHSQNHPNYQFIDFESQLAQTELSVKWVQEKFNQHHNTFSFPFTDFGVSQTFFDQINSKIDLAATFGTAGLKNEIQLNHFQRIPFEEKNLTSKEILNAELVYYLMKKPLGKNTIHRK